MLVPHVGVMAGRARSAEEDLVDRIAAPIGARRMPAQDRVASPHDRRARNELLVLLALLIGTLAVSFLRGQDVFIFAYIMTVVVAVGGPRRHHRPWSELGVKGGFVADLRSVWLIAFVVAVVFQLLPPTLVVASGLGYADQVVRQITDRLAADFGPSVSPLAVMGLLGAAAVLVFVEEVVYRVTIQERLSWFIGTPAAIVVGAILFGLAHAVATTGSPLVVATDVSGVVLDGVFFGIIYAMTHNLAVTWATHYAADVVGLIALALIF